MHVFVMFFCERLSGLYVLSHFISVLSLPIAL